MTKEGTTDQLWKRYALTGAALGLYFGWFFRPAREPNFLFVLALAFLAALVLTGLFVWQKRPSLAQLPARFGVTFIKLALALALLEGRHMAFDWGGRTAVILFTVLMGGATGLWFAYDQMRQGLPTGKGKKKR